MGVKGEKLTKDSVLETELLFEKLASIEGISSKRMFGGHGIFSKGKMFCIIDSKGQAFLKADDSSRTDFEEKGSIKHGRMPYYTVPEDVFNNTEKLILWAKKAIQIAK